MKKRLFCLLICMLLCVSLLPVTASADFSVSYYNEEVYAGGVLDMMAFVGEGDLSGYTFQWQADAGSYLMQQGLMVRTPKGRQATARAYEHLGIPAPEGV